ncbi:spondin domain-containing protein [Pelagicoccus sp. SDUM812002]|uniref:spondin domain-containing protein n=1 Tax=Pelagicoccus sp. SDUM812002 TaxID=3041266 RepID=UPI00280C8537|nr:spondin domain-containing protein [Pelagicoccus sp. SDUM812002]MDQ8186703.1 spondin domain-containing protein [Pelagicoccus sp. SDUM812002]
MYTNSRILTRAAIRGIAAAACFAAVSAHAITVKVKVENISASDGLWFTPVFFGFHDGSFDTFDPGATASASIEAVAEGGDASGLISDISGVAGAKSHVLLQDSSGAPPGVLFAPGESNYFTIDLDSMNNRYLSFASMLLPSNDAFFGNADPMQYDLFDSYGNFKGYQEIALFGSSIWDAGTELNDFMGAAFSPLGGLSTDTLDAVSLLGQSGLNEFKGAALATGGNLSSSLMAGDQVARISIQQVPDTTQYIGFMGAIALIGFRFVTKRRMGKAAA